MNSLLVAFVAFLVTVLLVIVLKPIAHAVGLLDVPDARKTHEGSVPLVGGIAIYIAVVIATLFGMWLAGRSAAMESGAGMFLLAALLLVVVGVWDDLRSLSPRARFVAQICSALVMVAGGSVVIEDLGNIGFTGEPLLLGTWSVPFTVFATVGVINAMNMTDGIDGLVGNMTLVSLLGLGAAMTIWGGPPVAAMINILSAAVIGFLLFNQRLFWRARAAIFLGDAGSMMLGLAVAWGAIVVSQGPDRAMSPPAALWFVAVPICDTLSVFVRRLLEGNSPFYADSRHLHHLFIRTGFTVNETLLIMCGMASAGVAVGLAGVWYAVPDRLMLILFVLVWLICLRITRRAWLEHRFLGRDFQQ